MKTNSLKKIASIVMVLVLALGLITVLAACNDDDTKPGEGRQLKFAIPDGAPLLAAAEMAVNFSSFTTNNVELDKPYTISYEILTGANLQSSLLNGIDYDIALAPINTCAAAYNNNDGGYILAGVAVWGLNHVMTNDSVTTYTSLSQLKGKTVYAFQTSGTPGLTLKAVLSKNNVQYVENETSAPADKVNIVWCADASAAFTQYNASTDEVKFVLQPEPVATARENAGLKRAFDIQKEWGEESYPQVGLLVKKSLVSEDAQLVGKIVEFVKASCDYAIVEAAGAAEKAIDTLQSSALPAAPVVTAFLNGSGQQAFLFKTAAETKSSVNAYLTALHASAPTVVGGSVPKDDFYYGI